LKTITETNGIKVKTLLSVFGNIIFGVLIFLFIISIIMSVTAKKNKDNIPSIFGYKIMTVLTGSMAPDIRPGDIIIDKHGESKDIKVGDVITYRVNSEIIITHRIIEVANKDGQLLFKTKGDANNVEDNNMVTEDQLIGNYCFRIPYGGYVSKFLGSKYGFVIFILIPIAILLQNQVKSILSDIKKRKNIGTDNIDI